MDSSPETGSHLEALECRLAAVNVGLVEDKFASLMVSNRSLQELASMTKEPLILRGTALRGLKIDEYLEDSLKAFGREACQVINIGAGLDTRCLRFPDVKFFEVDFEQVIREKRLMLKGQYHDAILLPCDINNVEYLMTALAGSGFSFSRPAIVLAECCLMYLERTTVLSLFRSLYRLSLSGLRIITFDAIYVGDHFGMIMKDNLSRRNYSLPFFESCLTVDDYVAPFSRFGLLSCNTLEEAYRSLDDHLKRKFDRACSLDEFEEWNLMSAHYVFTLWEKA